MDEKLHFTAAAKVIALLSIAVGVLLLVLAIAGMGGNSSSFGDPMPWEAFPEFYLGAGLSGVVSGVIIGVLYEISRNIAAGALGSAAISTVRAGGSEAGSVTSEKSADKRSSDPAYKYVGK